MESTSCIYSWLIAIAVSIVSGPICIILLVMALWCVGFTALGVAGGSIAAATQSGIGLVPAGSCFSLLQGIGAGGVAAFHPVIFVACSAFNLLMAVIILYYAGCWLSDCPCH